MNSNACGQQNMSALPLKEIDARPAKSLAVGREMTFVAAESDMLSLGPDEGVYADY